MKRIIALALALVLVLGFAACGTAKTETKTETETETKTETGAETKADDGEKREWKKMNLTYSTFLAADAPSQTQINMFIDKVNERMDGAITIETYANGSMLGVGDTFNGIATGVADIGFVLTSTCVGQLPMTLLCDTPGFKYNSGTAGARAMYDYIKWVEENTDEFKDVKVLTVLALAPQCFSTKKALNSLDDFKGLQLYCPASFTEAIKRWGATPASIPSTEIYEACRNGLIDGTCRSVGAAANGMMDEVTNYATVCFLLGQSNLMVMNRQVFESMPDYQQELFMELWDEVQHEFVDYMLEDFSYGDDTMSQNYVKNVEHFGYLDESLSDEMYELVKDLPDQYAKDLDAQGMNGTDALAMYRELLDKYNEEYPTDFNIYTKWRTNN